MHYRNHLSPPQFPYSWASAWGEDRYGLWMTLTYQGAELTFRWILPGEFMMGSPKAEIGRYGDEDLHRVIVEQGFWLADTPVTQAFWLAVTNANPSDFKGDDLPVEKVSWDDVQTFIQTLNQLHSGLTVRLPWEAEWEYACRAGTTTPFSFGSEIDLNKVNYRGVWEYKSGEWHEAASKKTSSVRSYSANPWGLYDMHGNVWEWCQDEWQGNLGTDEVMFNAVEHSAVEAEKKQQSPLSESAGLRVVRGGSWNGFGRSCRSAYRDGLTPVDRDNYLGFRLALGHLS